MNIDRDTCSLALAIVLALGVGCSSPDDAEPGAKSPTAIIDGPGAAVELETVTLSGRRSTDDDGYVAAYEWKQLSGPAVSLAGAQTSQTSFVVPMIDRDEMLVFELTVRDDHGNAAVARTEITLAQSSFVFYVTGDPDGAGQELWRVDRLGNTARLSPPAEAGVSVRWFAVSPDRKRVAIERRRTGRSDIWLVDSDGASLRRVTAELFYDGRWMNWSPDSRYLGFVAKPPSGALHEELYAVGAAADVPIQLSRVGSTDDFDNVAVASGDTINMRNPDGIPDSAGTAADGVSRARVLRVTWSSRSMLAFVAEVHGDRAELFTVNPDGSELTQRFDVYKDEDGVFGFDLDGNDADSLPDVGIATRNNSPRWSPDGNLLAFALEPFPGATESAVGGQLFTIHLDDAQPTLRLVDQPAELPFPRQVQSFDFSPDGAHLVIRADRDYAGVMEVFSQDLMTGVVRKVGAADLDLFPADGSADTNYNGTAEIPFQWLDAGQFVFRGDLRRDNIFEYYVGRVDHAPATPADLVSLTDVFSADWNHDGVADFDPTDASSAPASGWCYPSFSGIVGQTAIAAACVSSPDMAEVFAISTGGSARQSLYSLPLGAILDDLQLVNAHFTLATQYTTTPDGVDLYEQVLVSHAGGATIPVIDLFADHDSDGRLDYDEDDDGWPDYSVDSAACVDPRCDRVIAVLGRVGTSAARIVLSEPASRTVIELAAHDDLRFRRVVVPAPAGL